MTGSRPKPRPYSKVVIAVIILDEVSSALRCITNANSPLIQSPLCLGAM